MYVGCIHGVRRAYHFRSSGSDPTCPQALNGPLWSCFQTSANQKHSKLNRSSVTQTAVEASVLTDNGVYLQQPPLLENASDFQELHCTSFLCLTHLHPVSERTKQAFSGGPFILTEATFASVCAAVGNTTD